MSLSLSKKTTEIKDLRVKLTDILYQKMESLPSEKRVQVAIECGIHLGAIIQLYALAIASEVNGIDQNPVSGYLEMAKGAFSEAIKLFPGLD